MKTFACRNVHEVLPFALDYLQENGIRRDSRNGPVLVAPEPVSTEYTHPTERVLFWEERDANPAFHLYESLWMLAGRNDVAPLLRYVKRMADYSDNGRTLHDAYGFRWRTQFGVDQLEVIARQLRNSDERRCVLQMWNTVDDLGRVNGRAVPCNLTATFQRDLDGNLDLVVFNRSNDILWGAYGANAVQFGTLLEYMAIAVGCPVGRYHQISVNWHAYLNTFDKLSGMRGQDPQPGLDPYSSGEVRVCPLGNDVASVERDIDHLLIEADTGFVRQHRNAINPFFENAYRVLYAHDLWATLAAPDRYTEALAVIKSADQTVDWIVAMRDWLARRKMAWEMKQ